MAMKINPNHSYPVPMFKIQSKSSKSDRTVLTKLMPEQFTVLLGTGSPAKSKSQVGGVLVAVKILLSVGSIISHKKDCLKMCDHPKNSKSQVRRSFGGWENLAFCRKHYLPQKRLPQNV